MTSRLISTIVSTCGKALVTVVMLCVVLSACTTAGNKPASSNQPYQVLIIGDMGNIMFDELSDTISGLPQPEPAFDVITARDSADNEWQKLTRAIVRVETTAEKGEKRSGNPQITVSRDVYAKPQLIITVKTTSEGELRNFMSSHHGIIRRTIEAFEMATAIKVLRTEHNEKAENMIRSEFGIRMLIPADMLASKREKDFLWLSNNTNEGLQNICVYRTRENGRNSMPTASQQTENQFIRVRDSVMRRNIPGERDGMFMETATIRSVEPAGLGNGKDGGRRPMMYRGLWDMRNDIMGGPFVTMAIRRSPYIIYIEGFVYAPEAKKRNKIRRLEASILSALAEGDGKK